ncbi:MAG: histone [Candidatus Hadarchaeaceae archaeon]
MPEFSIATIVKLMKRVTKVRVSKDAALELSSVLEDYGQRVAKEAIKLRDHRGAKTLSKDDVKAAVAAIPR